MYTYICIYIYIYVYLSMYIYIHRDCHRDYNIMINCCYIFSKCCCYGDYDDNDVYIYIVLY